MGIVSGTIDIVGENFNNLSISQFKMDQDKSAIVGVDTDFEGFLSIITLIKGESSAPTDGFSQLLPIILYLLDD